MFILDSEHKLPGCHFFLNTDSHHMFCSNVDHFKKFHQTLITQLSWRWRCLWRGWYKIILIANTESTYIKFTSHLNSWHARMHVCDCVKDSPHLPNLRQHQRFKCHTLPQSFKMSNTQATTTKHKRNSTRQLANSRPDFGAKSVSI